MDDKTMREKIKFQDGGILGSAEFRRRLGGILTSMGINLKPDRKGRPPKY